MSNNQSSKCGESFSFTPESIKPLIPRTLKLKKMERKVTRTNLNIINSKIEDLAETLQKENIVEFFHKDFYYEIFTSADSGYVINIYTSDERDEDGELIEANMIDGGLCSGSAKDAIGFML